MFCSRCGTKNDDGSRFCYKCGAPLETNNYGMQNNPVQHQVYQRGPFDSVLFLIAVILTTVTLIITLARSNPIAQISAYLQSVQLYFDAFGFIATVTNVLVVISSITSVAILIALWIAVLSRFLGKGILNIGATIAHVVLVIYAVMMFAAIVIAVYAVVSVSNLLNMYGGSSDMVSAMAFIYVYIAIIIAICILFAVFYLKAAKAADKVIKSGGKLICSGYVPVFLIVMAALGFIGMLTLAGLFTYAMTSTALGSYGYIMAGQGTVLFAGLMSIASMIIFAIWIFKNRVKE